MKIVIVGAGSHAFSRLLISDFLSYSDLRDSTITLMDIDKEMLDLVTAFAKKLVVQHGFNTRIESTMNRREALDGADYVITMVRAGGFLRELPPACAIPMKYEVNQGTTDGTIGPGGVFYGLRQIPLMLDICRDMEELCPDAWLINYTNPMAMVCWAINDYTHIKNVGLCHSVQHTAAQLAKYIGAPYDEISYWVAGINHMAWFLEFKWQGKDAYPLLREKFKDPEVYSKPDEYHDWPDIVCAEIFKTFGYYTTEGSRVQSQFHPYFRKRPDLIEKYGLPPFPLFDRVVKTRRAQDEELRQQLNSGHKFEIRRSLEYCPTIIHSIETGIPSRINGNVKNTGLITNLPDGCCVEVPCLVDKEGVHPCYIGNLPPQLAALNRTSINVQELAVRGIVEKDKTKIFQAILFDPLTSAILTIDETRQMVDEIFQADPEYLKGIESK
ncbi:MAG: alpha-galactosidase [Desulfobacterales bacterium]|nr:alpha-galactosidase [Desulfobacterales bacterium]